ncbi:putative transmembrane protein [Senna tora]|uniref:Putative transmembrane protein n=1 Tax=Senna tora TaxID=362788 RepID=A0A834TCP3_9FABA|nr:putative transmembrane protein [Senna tora]
MDGLSEMRPLRDQIIADPIAELSDDYDNDEDSVEQIIYTASFQELATNSIRYDTVIWLSVSLLLVLAWGVGVIMLLYLPIRRYVLQKDLSSRELYVTATKIVYKVSRPSFIPFWGIVTIEKHVPLTLVIDIIIEQVQIRYDIRFILLVAAELEIASLLIPGCLQSIYGVHTSRVESIAHGKAAPVDELQVQGVSNPDILRKVIIAVASKIPQYVSTGWKPTFESMDVENMAQTGSMTEESIIFRSPSKTLKMRSSPYFASPEQRTPGGFLLNKLEEVNRSVKVCLLSY